MARNDWKMFSIHFLLGLASGEEEEGSEVMVMGTFNEDDDDSDLNNECNRLSPLLILHFDARRRRRAEMHHPKKKKEDGRKEC